MLNDDKLFYSIWKFYWIPPPPSFLMKDDVVLFKSSISLYLFLN